jgi:glycosyltransferase involved in cell wall biosynthesis
MAFPKVLIIGESFTNNLGGGITLSNLFSGWDIDKIAVACNGLKLSNNIDINVCNTYYQLGMKENKWIFPFNLIKRKYPSGVIKLNENNVQNLAISKSKLRVRLIMNYFMPFLEYFGLIHIVSKTILSEDFCKWLDSYLPDVLYVQATSLESVVFYQTVHSYLKKPLIFHMMDDWPSYMSNKGPFKKYWHKKIDNEMRILIDKASVLMCVSDAMAEEYKVRYNKDFIAFHNPIEVKKWLPNQKTSYEINDILKICYTGRIGTANSKAILFMSQVINDINHNGTKIRLDIFTLDTDTKTAGLLKKLKGIQINNTVSHESMPALLSSYDLLFLPLDFDESGMSYAKFSMPTKVSEYMISGTPILVYADKRTALAKYALKYGWACVVTESSEKVLTDALNKLFSNISLRKELAEKAKKIVIQNHDADIVRENVLYSKIYFRKNK